MKKLIILALIAGAAYGAYWYMGEVHQKTFESQGVTKKSEKMLESMDGQDIDLE